MNNNLCICVKNKNNLHIQCNKKVKDGHSFCGIHLNSKNKILFVSNHVINSNNNDININHDMNTIHDSMNTYLNIEEDNKKIYKIHELYDIINNKSYISIYSLRQSIKSTYLHEFINTKQSKPNLINNIINFIERERYFLSNSYYIILIQSLFRKWLIYRRYKCFNDTDILTFTDKFDIESMYFYIFYDKITKKKFAYDIRTLLEIIKSDYPSCPYTFRKFSDSEKKNIFNYCNKLEKNGICVTIEKPILTLEEETEMKIKDVFHKINMLDNYTSHEWFKNLNIHQLINLYFIAEDIWIYRSMISEENKKKIVKDGIAFNIPKHQIKFCKSYIKLQNIILDEFNRFVTEGINIQEKKLGAMLILTALVEISNEAALALPHLIQI
jgi:hypothetical protein